VRWCSVFEPSDGAATHWRPPETALSYPVGTRVVGAFGLLSQAALKRTERAIPRSALKARCGSGGGLALATKPVRMRVSLVYIGIIVGMVAFFVALTLLGLRVVRWRRDLALRRHGAPVLVMPLSAPDGGVAPRPVIPREERVGHSPRSIARVSTSPRSVRTITPHANVVPIDVEPEVLIVPDDYHETLSTGPFRPSEARPGSPSAHLVEGSQVRFFRAEEGTLEFLPGRLEVVGGEDIGQEIHFARQVGDDEVTVTFGRSEGPPLRHVQLLDPTVSRQHARMTFTGQRWHLSNMSTTNAVLLNGAPLPDHGDGITLQDGDRLEMGAVVFVFHAR
jgi:hypothetical protein